MASSENSSDDTLRLEGEIFEFSDGFVLKQPTHMIVIYTLAYVAVFFLGVTGNALVVWVVLRNPRMHNVTNYFIVNLAVADILVCVFCLPITLLTNLYSGWNYGAVMCKATPFLQGVSVSASVNTLMAIAFDRYFAICHGLKVTLNRKVARIVILVIWVFACSLMSPWAVYYREENVAEPSEAPIYVCNQAWPSTEIERLYFLSAIFLTCYTIPLICIIVCYALIGYRVCNRNAPGIRFDESSVVYKSKVKVVKMLIIVVVVFSFSWLPLYVVNLRRYYGLPVVDNSPEFNLLIQVGIPVSQWCGSSSSCVNPIIYCFFSRKFRNEINSLVRCWTSSRRSRPREIRAFGPQRPTTSTSGETDLGSRQTKRNGGNLRTTNTIRFRFEQTLRCEKYDVHTSL